MNTSIIEQTLSIMSETISKKSFGTDQSRLIFMGNIHDSYPRRLLLDKRLSPTEKITWMMIRLFALQHQGAAFPSYDELQEMLSGSHSEKASRDTVSRSLLMLRLTGWLSLMKRVRDKTGIFRGNIYALHDEPLTVADAENFDPTYWDLLETCLKHNKKSLKLTAEQIISDIKSDETLRHRQKRVDMIESRLKFSIDTDKVFSDKAESTSSSKQNPPSSNLELGQKSVITGKNSPSSNLELGEKTEKTPSSEFELGVKSSLEPSSNFDMQSQVIDSSAVRNSNSYVRNNVSNTKYVYVEIPQMILEKIRDSDVDKIKQQLHQLNSETQQCIIDNIGSNLNKINNITGYFYSMLQKGRNGTLNLNHCNTSETVEKQKNTTQHFDSDIELEAPLASIETITNTISNLKAMFKK